MLILAIDSSTPVAGIALMDDEQLIREAFVNYKKNHSETLMPMVDRVLRDCERTLAEVDALAVTIGPGSFTGLRIGLAAVKGLSLATNIPVVAISTLQVLAHNIAGSDTLVCPALNARKQELYTAMYDNSGSFPRAVVEEMACSPKDLAYRALQTAQNMGFKRITLLGDGYAPYREVYKEHLGDYLVEAPLHLRLPRASALASLAVASTALQDFTDIMNLRPHYVRLSEAETRLGRGEL